MSGVPYIVKSARGILGGQAAADGGRGGDARAYKFGEDAAIGRGTMPHANDESYISQRVFWGLHEAKCCGANLVRECCV